MKFLIFLTFFLLPCGTELVASVNNFVKKTIITNEHQISEIDINGDGKVDRIETSKNGKLSTLEIDSDYRGKINQTTIYFDYESSKKPIEITKYDTNSDGQVDRVESVYKNIELDIFITTHEVDSKFNGVFDKRFNTSTKITQKKVGDGSIICGEQEILSDLKFLRLNNDIQSVNGKLTNGFFEMDNGYKVHNSCLNKWGATEFPKTLSASISNGFQCLKNLAQINIDEKRLPNGAANNLNKLDYLLSTKKVSIICNEQKYNWAGTSAHASVAPGELIQEGGKTVNHPFISINTNYPETKPKPTQKELLNLSQTLFHEQLHNIGIRHDESIEYPYTCETCCLSDKQGEEKENACKICSGAYNGTNDKSYLRDLIKWGKTSYESERSVKAIIKYQKEFKQDRWAIFAAAEASSDVFSPIGLAMSRLLKKKFTNLTEEEKSHLKGAEEYDSVDELKTPDLTVYANIAAEAMFTNYYEANQKLTLDRLVSQKKTLKALLARSKASTGNESYIYGGLKDKLKNIISDIWMDGYPNNTSKESDRAYDLMKEVGFL